MINLPDRFKDNGYGYWVYLEIPIAWLTKNISATFPNATKKGVRRKLNKYFAQVRRSKDGTKIMVMLQPTDLSDTRSPAMDPHVTIEELQPILTWLIANGFPKANALTYTQARAKVAAGEY